MLGGKGPAPCLPAGAPLLLGCHCKCVHARTHTHTHTRTHKHTHTHTHTHRGTERKRARESARETQTWLVQEMPTPQGAQRCTSTCNSGIPRRTLRCSITLCAVLRCSCGAAAPRERRACAAEKHLCTIAFVRERKRAVLQESSRRRHVRTAATLRGLRHTWCIVWQRHAPTPTDATLVGRSITQGRPHRLSLQTKGKPRR